MIFNGDTGSYYRTIYCAQILLHTKFNEFLKLLVSNQFSIQGIHEFVPQFSNDGVQLYLLYDLILLLCLDSSMPYLDLQVPCHSAVLMSEHHMSP